MKAPTKADRERFERIAALGLEARHSFRRHHV